MVERGAARTERRRGRRAQLRLRGRYLLSEGAEHPCESIDVSISGFAVKAYVVADVGERVVAYFDEIGRLEGVVVRRGDGWFAVEAKVPSARSPRLAQKLGDLSGEGETFSFSDGAEAKAKPAQLKTEFGQLFEVAVRDQNRFGARITSDLRLLPGTRVWLDQNPAVVVRETTEGFLISFADRQK